MAGSSSATASAAAHDPAVVAGIVVIIGDVAEVRPLPTGVSLVLGRGDGADVVMAHRSVSRHHARLSTLGGVVRVTDLGSRNGVQVNGRRIAAGSCATVVPGDTIALGDAVVLVTQVPVADASARTLADEVAALERRRLREALDATGGIQLHAARLLGVPRRTFIEKMKRHGLR